MKLLNTRLQVIVDRPERNPCCSSIIILLTDRLMQFKTADSNKFDKSDRMDIGR